MDAYWTPAHEAVENGDAEALARLLAEGADADGNTPLTTATAYGHDPALQLLQAHIARRSH